MTAQEDDLIFGQAVRSRRTQLGMTLDQLANRTGMSSAALSRVERGHLSPTLRNALAIAQGLGCQLVELAERDTAHITRAGDNVRFLDETTGIERLTLARPSPRIELVQYSLPSGAQSNKFAAHKNGVREIFHILSGDVSIHTEQEDIVLHTGDTATLPVHMEHWFKNIGPKPATIILTIID